MDSISLSDANNYDLFFPGVGVPAGGQEGEAARGDRGKAKPEEGNRASASRKREEDEGSERVTDPFEAGAGAGPTAEGLR